MNDILTTGSEIKQRIISEITNAKQSVYLAMAWFTDRDIANAIISTKSRNVTVDIILSSNAQNETVKEMFTDANIMVHAFETGDERGMMHHKFCLIDNRITINGSYNYSYNASNNNVENIHISDDATTHDQFFVEFERLRYNIDNKIPLNASIKTPPKTADPIVIPVKTGTEFEKVLDSMIAAEVGNFDRKILREQGFDRCNANNGDHQVLLKSFDTLYSVFINDIDVIEDKKKRLIVKIDEHKVKNVDLLNKNCELQIDFVERENEINGENLKMKKIKLEADAELSRKTLEGVQNDKISFLEAKNIELVQQIKIIERDVMMPKFKWFEFIPISIFNVALLIYLFIFYSSAAYILLFSVADAKAASDQGITTATAQVFNSKAIGNAIEKGGTAPFFIFLFVFIPLAAAIIDRFIKAWYADLIGFVGGIILLDGFVAFKVTQAIYDANYLQGNVSEAWKTSMAFTDTNFYLVFLFGAFGLLLFKFAFKKLINIFEDRNPDIIAQRNRLLMKHLQDEITNNIDQIMMLQDQITNIEKELITINSSLKTVEQELQNLPLSFNQVLQKTRNQLLKDCNTIEKIAAIYTMHIQSDNLPVSVDALKDRINVFLEGWNDFLYKEYSIQKAANKTLQAAEVAISWQSEKLNGNKIDKRVIINQGE